MSSELEIEEPEYVEDPYTCALPYAIHEAYYKSLKENSTVYVCAILNEEGKPLIYIEGNKTVTSDGMCRLFFEQTAAAEYLTFLAAADRSGQLSLVIHETTYQELTNILITLDKRNKDQAGRGFKICACSVYKGVIRVVDLFWSGCKDLMV